MKSNLHRTTEVISAWSVAPMMERKPRPTDVREFSQMQKAPQQRVYTLIKESSKVANYPRTHTHRHGSLSMVVV